MNGDLHTLDIVLRLGAAVGRRHAASASIATWPTSRSACARSGWSRSALALASLAVIEVKDLADHPDALSRVVQGAIQGIMAGISFIGAGVILRDREAKTVEGLTTAATVWVTAALGIACGLGAWVIAGVALALSLGLLLAVGWLERITPDASTGGTEAQATAF